MLRGREGDWGAEGKIDLSLVDPEGSEGGASTDRKKWRTQQFVAEKHEWLRQS